MDELEQELEDMMQDALNELEDDDDTNQDDSEQEESTSSTTDDGEDEEAGQDIDSDEEEDDNEDIDGELEEDGNNNSTSSDDDGDSNTGSDFKPIEVEINGNKISIDSEDELQTFVRQFGNQNKTKTQRKTKEQLILEQAGLSEEDLRLLADAKSGDKAAIAKLAKQSNVDIYDLDEDLADEYSPKFDVEMPSEVDQVAEEIMNNQELHTKFQEVVKSVPQDFTAVLVQDASALKNFAEHVESGLAQKIIPQAIKQQMLNGGNFIDHYAKIGREMVAHNQLEKTVRKKNPRAEELKKRARNNKGTNKGTKTKETAEDVWSMSDKEFEKKFGL